METGFPEARALGVSTLCNCWIFTRRDGVRLGATDHDADLVVDGVTCRAGAALASPVLETTGDLSPGRASGEGALNADWLAEDDLAAGLWDGARVDIFRTDWRDPARRVQVWCGRLSEVTQAGGAFRAELLSLKVDLERTLGRLYQRSCDARLGDARCRVDLSDPGFGADAEISAVLAGGVLEVTGAGGVAAGRLRLGEAVWMDGPAPGARARIVRHEGSDPARIELDAAPGFEVAAGQRVRLTVGCDRRFETCGAVFANRDNFRGFPHMPGEDAILAGPSSGPMDGGRR